MKTKKQKQKKQQKKRNCSGKTGRMATLDVLFSYMSQIKH